MSIFAPTLASIWRQVEDHGMDPAPLFEKHGIDAAVRFDPNARVPFVKSDRLLADAVRRTGDPFFGLKEANYFLPMHLGPLGFAWLASTSLRSALERLQRYAGAISERLEIDLAVSGGILTATIVSDAPSCDSFQRDSGQLAILAKMCRFIHGNDWNPLSVTLKHPQPADASYFFTFFRCRVDFEAERNSLQLDLGQAERRLSGANRQLAQLNDHMVVRYLAATKRDDIVNKVKSAILEGLGEGSVSESGVAKALYMSTRNLNRKLNNEGTTFKKLLLETRTELANQYISDPNLSLTEISYMLGFSEISAFSRAYRQWNGVSPSEARKLQLQAG